MNKSSDHPVTPRQVADKQHKGNLSRAIRMALDLERDAVRHNTQNYNANRYQATRQIADYEALKSRARTIKEGAIEKLPELLETLERAVKSRGGYFYLAKTGKEASEYITRICTRHTARLVIKAKSITSEEIRLNHFLEKAGMEVAETDLAEFILQVADEQPSHIVAPAIHRSRDRISQLFKSVFDTDQPLDTGEDLTMFARDVLRGKFLSADIGISGANMIAADSATLMLVESEGNIRMVTQAPSVHIALAGIEKIVPTTADIFPFLELLSPSFSGQPLTSYTSLIRPPLELPPFAFDKRVRRPREFHLVLIDNGRLQMREHPVFREALYCIRCSACLNSCANFQNLGGHAFGGETYSGGIGGSWEAGTGKLAKANFSELCTGCSRCLPQCPVRIDIPWLNEALRYRLNKRSKPAALSFVFQGLSIGADNSAPMQKQFFAHFNKIAAMGSALAPMSNWIANLPASRLLAEKMIGTERRRKLPHFHRQTLTKRYKKWKMTEEVAGSAGNKNVLILCDIYSNFTRPQAGMAVLKVLHAAGFNVKLSACLPDGRAALSQGMLETAQQRARKLCAYLKPFVEEGVVVVVIEPSVLALFQHDYVHLVDDSSTFSILKQSTYEPVAFLVQHLKEDSGFITRFNTENITKRIFYHSHCQQRTVGAAEPTQEILERLGLDVATSSVECCGMAGSFGYKKDFYDVSSIVADDLLNQIKASETDGERVLLASGISCYEQISGLTGRSVSHPMELLQSLIE